MQNLTFQTTWSVLLAKKVIYYFAHGDRILGVSTPIMSGLSPLARTESALDSQATLDIPIQMFDGAADIRRVAIELAHHDRTFERRDHHRRDRIGIGLRADLLALDPFRHH